MLNENKTVEEKKTQKVSNPTKSSVSNPLTKQMNALKKPAVKKPAPKTNKSKIVSDPISAETSSIVAKINNFNTNKTSNKIYGSGYMNGNSHKVIDYFDIIYSLNPVLAGKTSVQDLFVAIHNLFSEKLNHILMKIIFN